MANQLLLGMYQKCYFTLISYHAGKASLIKLVQVSVFFSTKGPSLLHKKNSTLLAKTCHAKRSYDIIPTFSSTMASEGSHVWLDDGMQDCNHNNGVGPSLDEG